MSLREAQLSTQALAACALLTACGAESLEVDQQRSGDDVDASGGTSGGPDGGTPPVGAEWQPWEQAGPPPYWARRFSGANGSANLVQATARGPELNQAVVAGGNSSEGAWLMALDEHGETRWSKAYPGLRVVALGRRAAGGYWTAAAGSSVESTRTTLVLAEMDAEGEILWARSYARPDINIRPNDARALTDENGDAGFIVAGMIGFEQVDGWLARFDETGQLLWEHFYMPTVFLSAVRAVEDGGFIALGALYDSGGCYGQRVSATGEVLWARNWGRGHGCSQVELFSKDGEGPADSMVAVGEGFVSMLSLDGELHWQLTVSYDANRVLSEPSETVVADENGISIATGIETSTTGDSAGSDVWWFELDHSGNPKDGQLFTRPGSESVQTLIRLEDGWLAAGQSWDGTDETAFTRINLQSWLFRFGADRSLEFTESSGIQRQALLPNVQMLDHDIEDVEINVGRAGPEPTVHEVLATDIAFTVQREERF